MIGNFRSNIVPPIVILMVTAFHLPRVLCFLSCRENPRLCLYSSPSIHRSPTGPAGAEWMEDVRRVDETRGKEPTRKGTEVSGEKTGAQGLIVRPLASS